MSAASKLASGKGRLSIAASLKCWMLPAGSVACIAARIMSGAGSIPHASPAGPTISARGCVRTPFPYPTSSTHGHPIAPRCAPTPASNCETAFPARIASIESRTKVQPRSGDRPPLLESRSPQSTGIYVVRVTPSNASAIPCPPPMHNVTMARWIPSRRMECSKRVASTAPVAPIG